MKKNTLIKTFAFSLAFLPLFASAEVTSTTTLQINVSAPSEAQIFTACSQTSIEVRDESIGSARTAYNNAMAVALDARKEAEKKAIAIDDPSQKKAAIVNAVDEYKKAVTSAQDDLTSARKEAWATFETNTTACRDSSKDKRQAAVLKRVDSKIIPGEIKAEAKAPTEVKTFREVIKEQLDSIKAFFKIGASTDTTTNVTM